MKLQRGRTLSGLKTVFQNHLLRCIFFLLLEPGLVLSKGGGGDGGGSGGSSSSGGSYSGGYSSSSSRWVFWYYSPYGYRECGNICIITFVIIGFVLLFIIGCGVWQCIQVKRNSKKRTNTQDSEFGILESPQGQDVEKGYSSSDQDPNIYSSSYIPQPPTPVTPVTPTTPLPTYSGGTTQFPVEKLPMTPPPVYSPEKSSVGERLPTEEISFDGEKTWRFVLPEVESGDERQFPVTIENHTLTFGSAKGINFSLQTNNPFFVPDSSGIRFSVGTKLLLHYYEVTILENPETSIIAVGVAAKPYSSDRLPGWEKLSIGYHSDTGHKFFSSNNGEEYGPTFGKFGDTIGCGYYPHSGVIFFTRNGSFLGNAFNGGNQSWFPTIGTSGPCKFEINFGERQEFKYKPASGYGPGAPY